MIHSVYGELIHMKPNLAVIECGGVGIACRTTSTSLEGLKIGEKYRFITHMNVREDAIELFGFITTHELDCFKMLLSISGVGPKYALAILSEMSPQNFALAVVADDVNALKLVKGIGLKTAQLIILKLKDKLSKQTTLENGSVYTTGPKGANNTKTSGGAAISALMVLGFTASESATALSGLSEDMETSDKIKQALKNLSSKKMR